MTAASATAPKILLAGKTCHMRNSKFAVFDVHLSQNLVKIHTSTFYYVVQHDKTCSITYLNPEIDVNEFLIAEVEFQDTVKEIQLNNDFFLILTDAGELHKYDFRERKLKPVTFLKVENSGTSEVVTQIAVGDIINVAVTNKNNVFAIPNKIFELPKHEKVKRVCCGAEHALLLTVNGDVYSWGTGLRGQLGHGEICSEDKPRLIEALAGVKIVDISAGGWTSAAVSSFGDLYTFGWNPNGQLGLPVCDENPAVYATPKIIEFTEGELSIESVACGSRHTMFRTNDNRYFVSGSNKYGQLGLGDTQISWKHGHDPEDVFIDKFTLLAGISEKLIISCGYWSSLLTEYRQK